MYKPQIKVLWGTPEPGLVVSRALAQTMHMDTDGASEATQAIVHCWNAQHASVFEHVSLCVEIKSVSRAFMAQITRHRHLSPTCSSQHYQDYSGYPVVCSQSNRVHEASKRAFSLYTAMIDNGVPKEEARMCLPESAGVNMILTGNARAWAEMLVLRLCYRNVAEMVAFAEAAHTTCLEWFPTLFNAVGKRCKMGSPWKCIEGRMACGRQ